MLFSFEYVLAPFVEKAVLYSLNCLCPFVKNQLPVYVWAHFWTVYSISLLNLSVFRLIPQCLDYCSFVVSLKIKKC